MTKDQIKKIIGESVADEKVKAILDINSADIEKIKTNKLAPVQSDLEKSKKSIISYEATISELKNFLSTAEDYETKFKKLQQDINEREEAAKNEAADRAQTEKILEEIGTQHFINDYTKDAIISAVKKAAADLKNKGMSYKDLFIHETNDRDNIFAPANQAVFPPKIGEGLLDKENLAKLSEEYYAHFPQKTKG